MTMRRNQIKDLLYFTFVDHAIFRALWSNTHKVAPNLWRSNHPTFARLKRMKQKGITHVLTLRGGTDGVPFEFEQDNCQRLGLKFTVIGLGSRDAAPKHRYIDLLDFFDAMDSPVLMHCKSGADRTSLAAAFYLIYKHGTPIREARKQLSPRYLHFKWTKSGILDYTLDEYERFVTANPDKDLRHYFEHIYDAGQLKSDFNAIRRAQGKSTIK